jgi:hypothetical protein
VTRPPFEPFVRFPKELYDAFLRAPMPAGRRLVCLVAVRMTLGDRGRHQAAVSLGALQKATGRSRSALKADLDDLLAEGVLIEVQAPTPGQGRVVALNRDATTWGRFSVALHDIPGFLRHDWEPVAPVGEDAYRVSAWSHTAAPHVAVPQERTPLYREAAPTTDQTGKTDKNSLSGSPALLRAPSEADWSERSEKMLCRSAFSAELRRLAELLAAANKTGKVSLRRVVCDLYEPLVSLESELSAKAVGYGLRAAIAAGVPNPRYAAKAARSFAGRADQASSPAVHVDDICDYDNNFLTTGAAHA